MNFAEGNSFYWFLIALIFFIFPLIYKKHCHQFFFLGFAAFSTGICGALGLMNNNIFLHICAFLSFYLFWYMLLWKFAKMLEFTKYSNKNNESKNNQAL